MQTNAKKRKVIGQAGFTFIELMIAMGIASLSTLFFISTQTIVHQNSETAYQQKLAIQDAHRLVEDMRYWAKSGTFPANVTAYFTSTFRSTTINSTYCSMDTTGSASESMVVYYSDNGGTSFSALTSASAPTANPMLIKVTVSWSGYNRRTMTQDLATYITQRP